MAPPPGFVGCKFVDGFRRLQLFAVRFVFIGRTRSGAVALLEADVAGPDAPEERGVGFDALSGSG